VVERVTATPTIPADLKRTCLLNGQDLTASPDCPVVTCDDSTYFPFSYIDNRSALAIVGYDASGQVTGQLELTGARYVHDIRVDAARRTVTFVGQGDRTVVATFEELRSL
jgi:hypothetical protein